jgi:hypothetical protein
MTDDFGDFSACPFYEDLNHLPERCRWKGHYGLDDIWQFFVVNRAGKSQFRTTDPALLWPNLVRWRLAAFPDEAPLPRCPHSREFAAQWYNEKPDRWKTHDYKSEPANLVADPRTADRVRLVADRELALPYHVAVQRLLHPKSGESSRGDSAATDDNMPMAPWDRRERGWMRDWAARRDWPTRRE